jgi:hypothetical protein
MRGPVCRFQLLLGIASVVFLGSESRGTQEHYLPVAYREEKRGEERRGEEKRRRGEEKKRRRGEEKRRRRGEEKKRRRGEERRRRECEKRRGEEKKRREEKVGGGSETHYVGVGVEKTISSDQVYFFAPKS